MVRFFFTFDVSIDVSSSSALAGTEDETLFRVPPLSADEVPHPAETRARTAAAAGRTRRLVDAFLRLA